MDVVENSLDLLGFTGVDRVTKFSGVVSSVCFDLYGCVQVVLVPPVNADGALPDGRWFDVSRIEINGERVMAPPSIWTDRRGGAEKPARRS